MSCASFPSFHGASFPAPEARSGPGLVPPALPCDWPDAAAGLGSGSEVPEP